MSWEDLSVSEEVLQKWFEGKQFTADWTSYHIANWARWVSSLQGKEIHILELGSLEGRSAIAWLNLLPRAKITCVDAFFDPGTETTNAVTQRRFDENLAEYAGRVEKFAEPFRTAIPRLLAENRRFDLIYNDGDHRRDETLVATALTWPMLRQNGIYIWDDYLWEIDLSSKDRPQEAIDWFQDRYKSELEIIDTGYQIAVRRLSRGAVPLSRNAG